MHAAKVPYLTRKTQREVSQLRGINYTDRTQDGDLADSQNLSARRFPFLATRSAREAMAQYESADAYYCFDGHTVVCAGGRLLFDGEDKCDVSEGAKQFAVVGTKLVVFPDKVILDVQSGEIITDGKAVIFGLTPNSSVFADQTITLLRAAPSGKRERTWRGGYWYFYTYGSDVNRLLACYENNAWNTTALAALQEKKKQVHLREGMLLIPDENGVLVDDKTTPDISEYNTSGVIAKITNVDSVDSVNEREIYARVQWELLRPAEIASVGNAFRKGDTISLRGTPFAFNDQDGLIVSEVDKSQQDIVSMSFPEGTIRGARWYCGVGSDKTAGSYRCTSSVKVDDTRYYCHFTATGTILAGSVLISSVLTGSGKVYVWMPDSSSEAEYVTSDDTPPLPVEVDDSVFKKNVFLQGKTQFVYDGNGSTWKLGENAVLLSAYGISITGNAADGDKIIVTHTIRGGEVLATYDANTTSSSSDTNIGTMYPYDEIVQPMELRIAIPDLDYICEHQNRLWGVVNAQDNAVWDEDKQAFRHVTSRVIVASALGEPTKFWTFEGLSTDAYQLAIAGEGDFTAIASIDGAVCAFKERKIHKILGSYPAEYYLSDRDAVGVQSGCAKSMARIGSSLIYKGLGGVYAYQGGTPTLISANLGTRVYYDAVGGADEDSYYLSCRDGENVWHLFNYDAKTGIWLHEDNTQAVDFANDGAALFFLDASGAARRCNGVSDDPDVVWSAQFSPLYETIKGRKRYGKILLRVDVPKGAWLVAEVRQDDSDWREVGYVGGGERDVKPMVIVPGRCDKFELRLRGKGPCTVLSMMREFGVGSDR